MALQISATDTELPLPVNFVFQETFLRNFQTRGIYLTGSTPGTLVKHGGTKSVKFHRIENLGTTGDDTTFPLTALAELQANYAFGNARDADALATTAPTVAVAKYGNFVAVNEETETFGPVQQMDKIMEVLGINAGRTLNILHRNTIEDAINPIYANNVASDGLVLSTIDANSLKRAIVELNKNSARPFTAMTTGSQNVGTAPILQSYWGFCHPDVAVDISGISGFKSVETYAGQVAVAMGEFGYYGNAGFSVRFLSSEDAGIDKDSGGAITSLDLISTTGTDADLYTTCIIGQDAFGSVGVGTQLPDGTFMTGEDLGEAVDIIMKPLGSAGAGDPYNEIATVAWKLWYAGLELNENWGRGIRSGATDLTN